MRVEYMACDRAQLSYNNGYDEFMVGVVPEFKISKDDFSRFMLVVDLVRKSKLRYVRVYYYPDERLIRIYKLYGFDVLIDIDGMVVKKVKISFFDVVELLRKLFMISEEFKVNIVRWIEVVLNNIDLFKGISKSYEHLGNYFIDYDRCTIFYEDLIDFASFRGCSVEWDSSRFKPVVDVNCHIIGVSYLDSVFLFNDVDFGKLFIRGSVDEYIELRNELEHSMDFVHPNFRHGVKQFIQWVDGLANATEEIKKVLKRDDIKVNVKGE